MAPGATYWFINYHTTDEFGQAVDYIANVLKPNIVVHSNSFLFGRFDGTGWFAQKVDEAAAAGVLWVNSAGNYRTRHWEGAWTEADGDGNLDVPGDGNAFRVQLIATSRPACDISWAGATSDPNNSYSLALYTDPGLTTPAVDRNTLLPIQSSFVALPDPHASLGPAFVSSPGPYYVAVRQIGAPPTTHLTVFCRMDHLCDRAGHGLELPHPGRRRGRLLGGRVRCHEADPGAVLVRGADRRRAAQAGHLGAHERLHHAWRSRVGRGQRLRRHLVRDAARGRRRGAPVGRGRGRRRRRQRRPARARPARRAGARRRRARGPTRLRAPVGCASTWPRPCSASPSPRPTRSCAARSRSRSPSRMGARSACSSSRSTARRSSRRSHRATSSQATWPTAGLAPGPHVLSLVTSDQSGNVATYTLTLRVDNDAPKVRLRAPAARAGTYQGRDLGLGARRRQRPLRAAADQLRRRREGQRLPPRASLQARRAATSSRSAARSRRQRARSCGGRCASVPPFARPRS